MPILLYTGTSKSGDFSITPSVVDNCLHLAMDGTADSTVVELLQNSLGDVSREVIRSAFSCVEFDIRELYLLNSSCLKVIATFVHQTSNARSVRAIRFVVRSTLGWQNRAVLPFQRLAPGLVELESR